MMNLKGVYKNSCLSGLWHFIDWMNKKYPEVKVKVGDSFRVNIAYKEGKKRKLKRKVISICGCNCCGQWMEIR